MPSTYVCSSTFENINATMPMKMKNAKVCIMKSRCTLWSRRVSNQNALGIHTFLALPAEKREVERQKNDDDERDRHPAYANLNKYRKGFTQNPSRYTITSDWG